MFAVVTIHEDAHRGLSVETYGPFASDVVAEKERQRIWLDRVISDPISVESKRWRAVTTWLRS